jgi:hypothetical protein
MPESPVIVLLMDLSVDFHQRAAVTHAGIQPRICRFSASTGARSAHGSRSIFRLRACDRAEASIPLRRNSWPWIDQKQKPAP